MTHPLVAARRMVMRYRHYESAFGPFLKKYRELDAWLRIALRASGDLIEFGVARGGTTCLIAERVERSGGSRMLYALDSFSGFHPGEFERAAASGDVTDARLRSEFRGCSAEYVERKLRWLGFDRGVAVRQGYFQATLPALLAEREVFCFALVDCDLAESVQYCLESMWPRLSPGGVLLVDDYGSVAPNKPLTAFSPGVRRVVDAFVARVCPDDHGYTNGLYHILMVKEQAHRRDEANRPL